jgi:hypothetical protein
MAAIDRFLLLVRDLRRNEKGIAVPTALMALVATFALASVAVMSTVDVQQGTRRDHESKEAIAAADAGANIALLRMNRFLPNLSVSHPCIGPSGEYQTASEGWCPATATAAVGNAAYSYRISAYTGSGSIDVVSVGSSGKVSRRVDVALKTSSGKNVFAEERLVGQEEIHLKGSFEIETSIGTNGNIFQEGTSGSICGNDRYGVGKGAPEPSCSGEKFEENRELPAITPPANIATENSNCLLAQHCTSGPFAGQIDTYTKKVTSTTPWQESTRTISYGSQASLTMNGNDYWVCKVDVNPGTLYMSAEAHVRIFVDTPEHCGMSAGATQVNIGGNSQVISSAFDPKAGKYNVPEIYLLGNGKVNLAGTSTNELLVYAPLGEIEMSGNVTWIGMMAARKITLNGGVIFQSNSKIPEPNIAYAGNFQRARYVECVGATATPPNASC